MKIAHIVTLVSADGAFGGPVSVASTQAVELAARGHDVWLLAGWDGRVAWDLPGVKVELSRARPVLPTSGFSGLIAPGLLSNLWSLRRTLDVVHLHMARDLISMPAALLTRALGIPVITQTHGMVMPDRRMLSRLMDVAVTRPTLRSARSSAYLTDIERKGLEQVSRGKATLYRQRNGVPAAEAGRQSIGIERATVMFCARLHPRKRVLAFAEMAKLLLNSGSSARFVIAGPDEGDLTALRRFIITENLGGRLSYIGPLSPNTVREWFAQVSVFVLPSDAEPFPMTVLEAMSEGVPCVVTTGCMIASELHGAAVVTDGSPKKLAAAVNRLLQSETVWQEYSSNATTLANSTFAIGSVIDLLENVYEQATG